MPRNPFWTSSDVALTLSLSSWQHPDGTLTFAPESYTTLTYDGLGSLGGQFTSGEAIDYITVNLVAGSEYLFLATGTYQVQIAIYDNAGYLLSFTDPDDIGLPDKYPQDSIVNFVAEYTGEYRLSISYANLTGSTGTYGLAGSVDYGADHKNNAIQTGVQNAISSVLRNSNALSASELADGIYSSKASFGATVTKIVNAADATTSVASMSYQFFTGKVPSGAGIDFLVSPTGPNGTNLNSAYYSKFDTVNRYINFAVNLGKNGEAKDSFAAKYGNMTLFDATKEAYKAIFGGTPTDAKVHGLIDTRVDYLAYYGGDGATGIGTKAAMVGFLLAAAATENVGVLARSNDAWLTDLSDGSAPFAVDILDPTKGYYKTDFIFGG